jgi:hypothetical protein
MKKFLNRKNLSIALVAFLAIGIFVASSGIAAAQTPADPSAHPAVTPASPGQVPDPSGCAIPGFGDPCTALVGLVLYVISEAMQLLIFIGGWMIGIGMALTTTIYSSQAVISGFGVTLALANLAFVLAIIVIAVATIFQSDTYGYKKALWRLVAMAILVNFGLVITAPIVGLANSMTNYFVTAIGHGVNGTNAVVTFSNTLANSASAGGLAGMSPTASSGVSPFGGFFQTLLSMIFTIIFKGLIAVVFGLLGILLIVRYVYLVFLLIFLPLAWVTWIFPNFKHQFDNWWQKFIHWTFFPPAALFTVWLAASIQTNFVNTVNTANSPATAIAIATGLTTSTGGTSNTGILAQLINSIVVMGVMIGGLIAASSLADKAGAWAVKQAKGISKGVGNFSTKQTKKAGRLVYQKTGMANVATALRDGRYQPFNNVPVLGWASRKLDSKVGRTMAKYGNNAAMVEEEKKNVPKDWKGIESDLKGGGLTTQEKFAWLGELAKQGKLHENTMIGREKASVFFDKNKDLFERYGQGKLRGDADKLFMNNQKYRDARTKAQDARAKGDDKQAAAAEALMATELSAFFKTDFGKADSAKVNANEVMKADPRDLEIRLRALAEKPELVPGFYKNLNGGNKDIFEQKYSQLLDSELKNYTGQPTETQKAAAAPIQTEMAKNKARQDEINTELNKLADRNAQLKKEREGLFGQERTEVDQEIAKNTATIRTFTEENETIQKANSLLNQQLDVITKSLDPNASQKAARLRKAKIHFDHMLANNATHEPHEEKEEGEHKDGKSGGDHKNEKKEDKSHEEKPHKEEKGGGQTTDPHH